MINLELVARYKLAALMARCEGMIFENLQRAHLNESMAYSDREFIWLADEITHTLDEYEKASENERLIASATPRG